MKRVTFANSNLQTCQGNAKNLGVEKRLEDTPLENPSSWSAKAVEALPLGALPFTPVREKPVFNEFIWVELRDTYLRLKGE